MYESAEMTDRITTKVLKELAQTGTLQRTILVGSAGRFTLRIQVSGRDRILEADRGHIREFATSDSGVSFLLSLGIARFEIDATHWEPKRRRLVGMDSQP